MKLCDREGVALCSRRWWEVCTGPEELGARLSVVRAEPGRVTCAAGVPAPLGWGGLPFSVWAGPECLLLASGKFYLRIIT